jgi:hypothetical protein
LSELNSSKWRSLDFSSNAVNEKNLRIFFEKKSFENLEELKMENLLDAQNLFEYLPWQSMMKLKNVNLINTDI